MRYLVKQKLLDFGDRFIIKDEQDHDQFIVRGKPFSLGKKLHIYDMQENELLYIEQKLFHLSHEFEIFFPGGSAARIKKKFAFFKYNFDIESDHGTYLVEGNFWDLEYTVFFNGIPAATVAQKHMIGSPAYCVDVFEGHPPALFLALAIVIDAVHK